MSAYLGALAIVSLTWASPRALVCRFVSSHDDCWHHLYGGRTLIGVAAPGQRVLSAQLIPARYPEHLTLLAVDTADRLRDFGDDLPPRPYNRVRLRFTAHAFPADAEFIDITASPAPDTAVDSSNRIARLLFDDPLSIVGSDRQFEFLTDPLSGTGEWDFTFTPRDDRPSGGNAGTIAAAAQDVLAHPPDVVLSSGARLSVAIAAAVATVTATIPAD